jgi:hypothetical protein
MMATKRQPTHSSKRRTTLTLPADALTRAENIARARKVNLSTVVSEALSEGLQRHTAAERGQEILNTYKRAFGGFSDEEMNLLDGIILEPDPGHNP